MIRVFRMPKLGVNMTEATISEWLVGEGDTVLEGQVVLLAETDKAVQEIPISESGTIIRVLAQNHDQVVCQQPILLLQDSSETVTPTDIARFMDTLENSHSTAADASPGTQAYTDAASESTKDVGGTGSGDAVRISPHAKKIARDLNIDYQLVPPSKPGARISAEDVLRYHEAHTNQEQREHR
jgi:pyruvate dehydrogenase E2 component (dihydrolipoamide acetyltransferase)